MGKIKSTIVRGLDPEVWREFKAICAKEDISLNQKIKELIGAYVKRNAK